MNSIFKSLQVICLSLLLILPGVALSAPVDDTVATLHKEWAIAKFETPRGQQMAAFDQLKRKAAQALQQYPNNAEVMMWYGTILATNASIRGGMAVLPDIKLSRQLLHGAINRNNRVGDGFAHLVLGALYDRAPGWPLAFGDKGLAKKHILIGYRMAPNSADANFYYGDFLVGQHDYSQAKQHLQKALNVPIRPGYEVHDRGRKGEIKRSMAKMNRRGL